MFWNSTESRLKKLHQAIFYGDSGEVKKLIVQGADPAAHLKNDRYGYEGNAFHAHAARRYSRSYIYSGHDLEIVAFLLSVGVPINEKNARGETPLHIAAERSGTQASKDCIGNLLRLGADPCALADDGQTPLHALARAPASPHTDELIKAFLSKGAGINDVDGKGRTPLMWAAKTGSFASYDLLAVNGADVLQRDFSGDRASGIALKAGHFHLAWEIARSEEAAEREQSAATPAEAEIAAKQEEKPSEGWSRLASGKIARVSVENHLGYKITEVFNFEAGTYICLSRNMETQGESLAVKTLNELRDTPLLQKAWEELKRQGDSDEGSFTSFISMGKAKGLVKD